jgi:hypothetical protein
MGIMEEGILMVDAPRHEEISMTEYENLVEDAITSAFGERCPEYAEGCFCCEAWKQYDELRAVVDTINPLENKPLVVETPQNEGSSSTLRAKEERIAALEAEHKTTFLDLSVGMLSAAVERDDLQAKLSKAVEALKAAEALAVCGMATDCYSRFEIDQISRATIETFRATLKEVGGDNE